MKYCANDTCARRITEPGNDKQRFCSRICQTRPNGYHLQQVVIPMWLYHRIEAEARRQRISFGDAVREALMDEFD